MKFFNSRVLYTIVLIISVLLIFNVMFSLNISQNIDKNIKIQNTADSLRYMTKDLSRYLAGMEMALRGYFLDQKEINIEVYNEVTQTMDETFVEMENRLNRQNFPMAKFNYMKEALSMYRDSSVLMMDFIKEGDSVSFQRIYNKYYGDISYNAYIDFEQSLFTFEDNLFNQAQNEYFKALQFNVWLSVGLIFIIVPVLIYSANKQVFAMNLSKKLNTIQDEKTKILRDQNEKLEKLVQIRTEEIETQNEELHTQNEELLVANDRIDEQNEIIKKQNVLLSNEVKKKTKNLEIANKELAGRIEKMEQFTYIVSHNLKSYVAQIKGLSMLVDYSGKDPEMAEITTQIKNSANNLGGVLNDLNTILQLETEEKKHEKVNLEEILKSILEGLNEKISDSKAKIGLALDSKEVYGVKAYFNSVLYNLISNSLKYRKPRVLPVIEIQTKDMGKFFQISVRDNGLGIDINKHKKSLFSIYKRFHDHIEGKGLGLYLCKTQIEAMGGTIEIESKEGEGTFFLIKIPQHKE